MPPKTRSRAKAPASRIYHSSPAPQQALFPPRTRIVKTYGKRGTVVRPLRQQTLTQLDYVTQNSDREALELEEDEVELSEPIKKQSKNRRKTLGDTPNSSSHTHTQTLTQFLSEKSFNSEGGNVDNPLTIRDSEDEDEDEDEDLPELPSGHDADAMSRKDKASSLIPETPSHKKIKVNLDEVPSSQPTPFTPMLGRYSLMSGRSPLIERSTNVDAPPPTAETISKIPRNITIQDTFSSSRSPVSSMPSDPPVVETPVHRPRRQPLGEIPVPAAEHRDESVLLGEETPVPRSGKENRKRAFYEIPDSDEESAFSPSPLKPASARQANKKRLSFDPRSEPESALEPQLEPELPGGVKESVESTSSDDEDEPPGTPTPLARKVNVELPPLSSPSVYEETPQKSRQKSSPAVPQTVRRETQPKHHVPAQRSTQRYTQHGAQGTQFYTQGFESQRVPLDVLRSLGPITDRSDILISVDPETADLIFTGQKDHEFRNYKLPPQATRCWIFIQHPVGELRFMATIGSAKERGEIEDGSGLGNPEFNNGALGYRFAHELIQVYELNNPVPLASMQNHGLGNGPPQQWKYIPPATVGMLLGNLQRALFIDRDQEVPPDALREIEEDGEVGDDDIDISISQELEKQIRSDIIQSTQMHSDLEHGDVIPATQESHSLPKAVTSASKAATPKAGNNGGFSRPALPTAASRSSERIRGRKQKQPSRKTPSTRKKSNCIPPSQATTVSQSSTPDVSPEKPSIPRPALGSSVPSSDFLDEGSPIRLPRGVVAGSSQGVMLDSLLVDDIRPPPELWQLEDDDDDDDDDD
ncbi:hypothetical protein OQA88_10153 [Cercophora sp. LCS_1]